MNETPITAIIPCKDELPNIEACVNSLRGLVDEIIIADSGSTDGTLGLVKSFPDCRVIEREYVNPSDFKNWAIPHAKHKWILLLDADERVSTELFDEIAIMKSSILCSTSIAAYWIARSNYFMGKKIRYSGWQNDGVVRLFRRECRYELRQVHEEIDMSQIKIGRLTQSLIHHTYRSFAHYLEKMQRYTTWGAQDVHQKGRPFRFTDLTIRPSFRFFRHYVLKRGFLDGKMGFLLASLASYSVFLKYAKLMELQRKSQNIQQQTQNDTLQQPEELNRAV